MPQNPCVIATKTPSSDVLVFDYTKVNEIRVYERKHWSGLLYPNPKCVRTSVADP
jgi:hypothetical protein